VTLTGKRAAILGAGGSARAVAMGLKDRGAHLRVCARNEAQAKTVADLVGGEIGGFPPATGSWDLLVNCTPIGMYPHVDDSPVPRSALSGEIVYDLVYNPTVTQLLRDAAAAGCEPIGGLEMLVAQAARQFEWWTGQKPAAGVMRAAATRRLSEFMADEHHLV
jgi:shikimate 5-dehydrogenase